MGCGDGSAVAKEKVVLGFQKVRVKTIRYTEGNLSVDHATVLVISDDVEFSRSITARTAW